MKAIGREPKSCLSRVFNFKLDCFVMCTTEWRIQAHPSLELKTRPRFCPVSWSLSMVALIAFFFFLPIERYLNEEVNGTEPSPSLRVPCRRKIIFYQITEFEGLCSTHQLQLETVVPGLKINLWKKNFCQQFVCPPRLNPGKPYWRGSISTVDLLVLTGLD